MGARCCGTGPAPAPSPFCLPALGKGGGPCPGSGEGAEGSPCCKWSVCAKLGSGGGIGFSVNTALVLCLGRDEGFCQVLFAGSDLGTTLIENEMKEVSVCPGWRAGRRAGCPALGGSALPVRNVFVLCQALSWAFGSVLVKTK